VADNACVSVGIIGHTGWDVVSTPTEATQRRLGGTPLYAARALRALGVEPVVITKGADLPDAIVLPARYTFESVLVHSADATDQQLASVGEPFTAAEARAMLPLLDGCEWVILGGQASTDFPTDMIAVLAAAGLRVCIDAQGLARGPDPGPLRLRPFPARAVAGASMLKLSQAEALAVCGTLEPEALASLGVPEVALTRGRDGAVVVTPDGVEHSSSNGAHFDDPTGAGDSWLAVYVLERSRGTPPGAAARAAVAAVDRLYAPAA
jgi:6-phosphofructokinase 2